MNNYSIRRGYRDPSIDVLKGLAIILVVYGHTWPFCRGFIYLFHMAVFMMASGYCYSAEISDLTGWGNYIGKKIRGLYIPFIICNGCFTLLSGSLLKLGLYTDNPYFLLLTEDWPLAQSLYRYDGIIGVGKQLVKVFLFIGITQLGTATWFLASLFFVLAVNAGIELLAHLIKVKNKEIFFGAILIVMLLAAQIISDMRPPVIFLVKCFPCMYTSFLIGRFIKKIEWKNLYAWWMGLISLAVLILFSRFFNIEVSAGRIVNTPVFVVSSLCGWVFLKSLSELLVMTNAIKNLLMYIGKHSMPILCLHVVAYKLISWLYIRVAHKPDVLLASFHVIMNTDEIWKFFYVLAGVCFPLLFYWVYSKMKGIIIK